jgi:tetratricopeptide (TPR) repeat protein
MLNFCHKISCYVLIIFFGNAQISVADMSRLSELELGKIIEQQNQFLNNSGQRSQRETTRQAQEIVTNYENFLIENPNDIHGLILFGKFLRKIGHHEEAFPLFLKADELDPNLAVVKQEIGNFLVENGQGSDAFPFYLMATRLGAEEPFYHHNLGTFIFEFREKLVDFHDRENLGILMHESFKKAAALAPNNFDFHLRFAQSFFDFNHSSQNEALAIWDSLLTEFGERTENEQEYVRLMKAKILLQTGKKGEAIQLIRSVKSSILLEEKNAILKTLEMDELQIQKTKKSSRSQNYITFPSYAQFHHFPMDANLRRIKVLTARLRQEQMLEVLQHDATHSKLSSNLEVTLEEGKQTIKINLSK